MSAATSLSVTIQSTETADSTIALVRSGRSADQYCGTRFRSDFALPTYSTPPLTSLKR